MPQPPSLSRRTLLASGLALPVAGLVGACRPSVAAPRQGASTANAPTRLREVVQIVDAQPFTEGAGVHLRRAIGTRALPMLDPFLMLDEIKSRNPEDYVAGFPTHPHRGFETVTIMLEGAMEHRDSLGNQGRLGPGTAQWMTAGHGILHSEMPKQVSGLFHGFQLWVNLPRARKMMPPRYQDIEAGRIPLLGVQDASVRLVAGAIGQAEGPVEGIVTAPHLLDVTLPPRGRYEHTLPSSHNAFAYVVEGDVRIGSSAARVTGGQLAVLERPGDRIRFASEGGGRLLLAAAQPLNEPVARYGPFVMSTDEELRQAVEDYRSGRLTVL